MLKFRALAFGILTNSVFITGAVISPVKAQLPIVPNFNLPTPGLSSESSTQELDAECIWLDGRCLFRIATQESDLPGRVADIQDRLDAITRSYLRNQAEELEITTERESDEAIPDIYVQVGDREPIRLMSVTDLDARLTGVNVDTRADQITEELRQGLIQAKQERQPRYLMRHGAIAAGTGAAMLLVTLAVTRWERRSKQSKEEIESTNAETNESISTQLTLRQQFNLKEVQHRLLQLGEGSVLAGGSLYILGLFPYTRVVQTLVITALQVPMRLGVIGLGTYVIIRLSFALIDKFTSALADNHLLTPEADRRVQLRVSTISGVAKSVVAISWVTVASLVALAAIGVDIGPLLAGAGLVGVAVSFASQNLIKDALNGFFIILEDQYAVGDVIGVGDYGGLVENLNLRITQLRDAEGRLITIPNSEVKIVANLSNGWSRADLNIPVPYHADIDRCIAIVRSTAEKMAQEEDWKKQILDPPQVLGVDNFSDRGAIVRVWIMTVPLKQWDVSREFRRRIKIAFDEAGIPLSLPQTEIWFNDSLSKHLSPNQDSNGNNNTIVLK
ncbi:mechanosensitive ion channel family protein [Oscillatoria salina]|uniref:mechanosensitive ion channel family protein n=1 Tax=Oscillatoria salina TaxID=331517 RepID=UPI0013B6D5D4|nr:mechanosensitive ion channel family protein [Oscillatoria salina]MBZ8178864.1 mechanosensitive ion channel family protein [Oscillatoria salina IIICB1]NET86710.1 mechanosensitive ion channel family protein [Kamptonema sp. SIO1D9]